MSTVEANTTPLINPIDSTNPSNLSREMQPALWQCGTYSMGSLFHWDPINRINLNMFRTLPPTAAPIPFRDLISGVFSTLYNNGTEAKFKEQIQEYFKVKHVFLVSSGKAAIYLTLNSLQQTSKRQEVIIPAYSSFCLASAVARTNLSIKLCDIDPDTLDFDLAKLKSMVTEKTLAVIPVHNYGLVCNMKEIKNLALEKGAYVVEDAAQAAGALFDNRKVGSFGDAGILSLGRGKNICALGGGVILTENEQISELIKRELDICQNESPFFSISAFLTGLSLSLLLSPERYVIPSNLPFLNLGANIFDPGFKVERLPNLNAEVGRKTFLQIDRHNEMRIENARLLRKYLCENGAIQIPKVNPMGKSVYLRFPIVFPDRETRNHLYQRLSQEGLGASCSYPVPLHQITDFKKYLKEEEDFTDAQFVSERILTLPTHPYVTEDDIKKIASVINCEVNSSLVTRHLSL
jgi:dTDP-4-amino-4,6-dideoxygalactose transaminase